MHGCLVSQIVVHTRYTVFSIVLDGAERLCRDALIGFGAPAAAVTLLQRQLAGARAAVAQLLGGGRSTLQAAVLAFDSHDASPPSAGSEGAVRGCRDSALTGLALCGEDTAAKAEAETPGNRRWEPPYGSRSALLAYTP